MIKTFLRRWYITNQLYHYTRKNGVVRTEEDNFVDFLLSKKLNSFPYRLFLILKYKSEFDLRIELRNLITECSKENINYIERESASITSGLTHLINLGAKGQEVYSFSYLIFGNISNIRKIIFALISIPGIIYYWNQILTLIAWLSPWW